MSRTFTTKVAKAEAVQWTGSNFDDLVALAGDRVALEETTNYLCDPPRFEKSLALESGKGGAQGWLPVPRGHWVVRDPEDPEDIWPVHPDRFAAKYEADEVAPDIKYMDLSEFRGAGYLQEVNRTFFHPLGLALEMVEGDDGNLVFGGVWDYRDDPEGMAFGDGMIDPEKYERISEEYQRRVKARRSTFGSVVQSIPVRSVPKEDHDD